MHIKILVFALFSSLFSMQRRNFHNICCVLWDSIGLVQFEYYKSKDHGRTNDINAFLKGVAYNVASNNNNNNKAIDIS